MRFPSVRLRAVLTYVGHVLFVFGFLLLIPLVMSVVAQCRGQEDVGPGTFVLPILLSLLLGTACRWRIRRGRVRQTIGVPEAMLTCVLGWLAVSAVGAIPFAYHLRISYLDAYFEAMSGFTTTGITMLTGLDTMPMSLLFWRSMTQWIGGLGILTFFLAVVFQGGMSHRLFDAESHKIRGPRPAPGMWNTLKILWLVYVFYTALITGLLILCGLSLYDALSHSLTCLSTGGYSPYDASIAHYEQIGQRHHVAVEYVIILGMWAGGTNFLVHYYVLRGKVRALWDTAEMRAWWLILGVSLVLVCGSRLWFVRSSSFHESLRHGLFQVTAIATTTGFATRDIASDYFTPLARQVFLVLMVIGGCAGSTGGGLKVIRVVILWKLMARQVRKALKPDSSIDLLMVDGNRVDEAESGRAAGLFFAWIALLLFGGLTTAALSQHSSLQSASGMFSALGNIGPCYISVEQMSRLDPIVKLVYIAGMLAGRLEIVPVLMLFSKRTWR